MRISVLLLCCVLIGLLGVKAQEPEQPVQLNVVVTTGGSAGWWINNKGFDDSIPGLHRGYTRAMRLKLLNFRRVFVRMKCLKDSL